ncbi:MAG TPA: hypothetical protein VK745_18325 [Polyangiaceae bacterium]|jgi:hypothetical protein|nr:hypothetical protein [Polyangiaceae bacterium]
MSAKITNGKSGESESFALEIDSVNGDKAVLMGPDSERLRELLGTWGNGSYGNAEFDVETATITLRRCTVESDLTGGLVVDFMGRE